MVRSTKSTYLLPHKCHCGERLHLSHPRLGRLGALLQHCGRPQRGYRPLLRWMSAPSDWLPTPQEMEYESRDREVAEVKAVQKAKVEAKDGVAIIKAEVKGDVSDIHPHLTGSGLSKADPFHDACFTR